MRDPFFNMLKRSLNTFMNAMTAPDYTMYPFSTRNATDYYNLLSVYLDAAFFPNITAEDFRQVRRIYIYRARRERPGLYDGPRQTWTLHT